MAEQAPKAKSLDEIAEMMAAKTQASFDARMARNKPQPNEVVKDEKLSADKTDADDLDIVDDSPDDDEHEIDSGTDDGGDEDLDADDGDDELPSPTKAETDEFFIDDEDLVELSDGATVSLGDLKKFYKADATITERLTAQDDATNEALRERAKALEDGQKATAAMSVVFQHIDQVVSQPFVSPPTESLKQSNPAGYIQQLDAYQKDQLRIQDARKSLNDAVTAHAMQQKELHQERQRHELGLLTAKIPALRNPETRTRVTQDIQDAATHYGFDKSELSAVADHRLLNMAYEAQQYRKLMSKSTRSVEDLTEVVKQQGSKQTRTLRSKGTTAKNRISASAKQRKVLVNTARKTGKVDDIAALIANKHST